MNADDSDSIRNVSRMITEAIERRASDIHIECRQEHTRVRYRIDGILHDADTLEPDAGRALLTKVKTMADLNVAETRLPQDGRILLDLHGRSYDLRVAVAPLVHGERACIRVLSPDIPRIRLQDLNLPADRLETFQQLCRLPFGMVICAGPTGSGKTTLMYAMLMDVDRDTSCVISAEDPVEYILDGVSQIPIAVHLGLTFDRTLRAILRQDPDVIMVGEIRDRETLYGCCQAALTGHLVMTQIHANTAPGVLRRLLDLDVEPFLINHAVAGVIAQRLVRLLCPQCRRPAEPNLALLPPEAVELVKNCEATFYEAVGCDACHGAGYRGRTAAHEVILPGPPVQQAVAANADVDTIRDAALKSGMQTLLVDGLRIAMEGRTSIAEAVRVTASRQPL